MSKQLRIYKVNSKPTVFQPSSLYLVKDGSSGLLYLYLTDNTGSVIYRTHEGSDISNIVNAILNAYKGQPNGLAILDANGLVPLVNLPSISMATADKLTTARTIAISGDASGSAIFDGSGDVTIAIEVVDDSHNHTFSNLLSKPTTLTGYGITDGISTSMIGQPNGVAGVNSSGQVVIDGQNIDLTGGGGIWDTLSTFITTKNTTGGNNPTYGVLFGNFQGYLFDPGTVNQFWVDFTIKHGITLDSKVYPFIHFMPLSNAAGTVRWCFEYTVAKGYGQESFPTTSTTVIVDHVIPANSQYKHMTAEASDASAILSSSIEPNSTIKMRVYRAGNNSADTYPNDAHAWEAGLHYQVARFGTKNRLPPFFS